MIVAHLALVFMLFEVAQLIVAQRFIGLAQIRQGVHPLDTRAQAPLWLTMPWLSGLAADYIYQISLLWQPQFIRLAGLLMILVSFVGFVGRRACGLKWGLVVLTLEGATRAGFLGYVFYAGLRHPNWFV